MSWEPAWVSDGRGGFVRNPQRKDDEGEEPPPPPASGGDDEEEGEISTIGNDVHRTNESFRPRLGGGQGPGNNNNRPLFSGGRQRHHGNFAGTPGNPPPPPGPPPFVKREGNFGGRGGGFQGRPASEFRNDPPPFHDVPPARDFRGDGPPHGGRDFAPFRSAGDGPRLDFRSNNSGDLSTFRPDEPPSSFRDRAPSEPPPRDFRDVPSREPSFGGPPASQRPPFRPGLERGRSGGVTPFSSGRPTDGGRESSFGALSGGPPTGRDGVFGSRDVMGPSRTDPVRENSFGARSNDPGLPPRELVRDGSFGPRSGEIGGTLPRDNSRDGSYGGRGGDVAGPSPRVLGRDGSFVSRGVESGLPPREPVRDAFGLRGGDMTIPPRDLAREGSFGPRSGDIGGPPRDLGRDGSFGPRGGDIGGVSRDPGRDGSFGPRGDIGGPPRELGSRGPGAPFGRVGAPPTRDVAPIPPHSFHRDGQRETTFSDLAGPPPPRDRSFRDESRGRGGSQGPPGLSLGSFSPNPVASDPRRPTDPRRRSSQDLGGLTSGASYATSEGPTDGLPIPSPQPGRRLGSYSSLADSSTMPPNLIPTQPPASTHDGGPGGFRSPAIVRRPLIDPARNDRVGNVGGPQRPSWSPALERRGAGSSPRLPGPPLKSPSLNNRTQTGTSSGNSIPPMAPSLSSTRGQQVSNFRDPRFKGNEKQGAVRPDSSPSASIGGTGGLIRKTSFTEGQDSTSSSADAHSCSRKETGEGSSLQRSPRSSPIKTAAVKTLPNSLPKELGKATFKLKVSGSAEAPKVETPAPPKPSQLPPLLTSALGEGEVVQRAETAVRHLCEVVGDENLKVEGIELSKLPAKQVIMSAVTEIEKMIKETQRGLEDCEEDKEKALQIEAEEEEMKAKVRAEEEARNKEKEKLRIEEEKKQQEKLLSEGLNRAIAESQEETKKARENIQQECEHQIQVAKQDHKRRLEEDLKMRISSAAHAFDKEIGKAKTSVEKAKTAISRVESKLAAAQSAYESLLESIQGGVANESKKRRVSGASASPSILVERIMAENQRKAREAHALGFSMVSENDLLNTDKKPEEDSSGPTDPIFGKTCEEWTVLANQVTGHSDALYSEPSEAPYYQHHEQMHEKLAPIVKEFIRDEKKRLCEEWTVLAEEYEVRKRLYEKQQRKLAKKAQRGSVSVSRKSILAGDKESSATANVGQGIDRGNILESGNRTSNNPYRRARRGNEVRSEYEQEQIIAEIAAKEAMEKRITHGGSKIPRQISRLERGMTASFVHTFTSHRIDDPLREAEEAKLQNVWTDMEKTIFLDRFLQFPKDFRRIASFLRNKTTKDCIAFYYDSKQTVPYKGALKEHVMRRKRKGDYQIWDASIQAAISVGATVTAGETEEKPLVFNLPSSDKTYRTYLLHPLRRPVLDLMLIDEEVARKHEGETRSEESKWRSRKRGREPLFSLDKEHTKYLRTASQESMSGLPKAQSVLLEEETSPTEPEPGPGQDEAQESPAPSTPARKAPQKWTAAEKRVFVETLEQYGRDWAKLAEAIGSKNEKQIKNFYYDWKKGKSRAPSEKKLSKKEKTPKSKSETSKQDSSTSKLEEQGSEDVIAATETRTKEKRKMASTLAESTNSSLQPSEGYDDQASVAFVELRAQAEARAREQEAAAVAAAESTRRRLDKPESNISATVDYGGANQELLQHMLNQQLQQQHSQQPQSALQQLLSQQHVQREQQQQQQLNQISLEEARRFLDHQNSRGSVLSNLLGSQWLGASQMLQGQSGLSSHSIAAALRGESNSLGGTLGDVSDLQRLLHMQQQAQGLGIPSQQNHLTSLLLGSGADLGGPSAGNLSNALLQQLASRGSGIAQASEHDHLPSLANAQSILGYGGNAAGTNSLANALYRQVGGASMDSGGVSDALSLLARSMQRNDGTPHGLGRLHDRSDGSGRYS